MLVLSKYLRLSPLWKGLSAYAKLWLELKGIGLARGLSRLVYALFWVGVFGCTLLFAALFFYLSVAAYLNNTLQSPYLGYLAVCLFFLLKMSLLALCCRSACLRKRVENLVIYFLFPSLKRDTKETD